MSAPRNARSKAGKSQSRTRKRPVERDPSEPLVDARIRPLLERYVSLTDAELTDVAEGLVELRLPEAEREWFQNRQSIRIAFTLDAFEEDPDAEIAVAGSPLTEQLIAAIRARGSRAFRGRLQPAHAPDATAVQLRLPVTNATLGAPNVDVAWHTVVRLLARVVVRAGSEVEEHLLESGFLDATTGIRVPTEIAEQCAALAPRDHAAGDRASKRASRLPRARRRPIAELLSLAMTDLGSALDPKLERLRDAGRRQLEEELGRIDSYYASLIADTAARADTEAGTAAQRTIEAEHVRRRAEEERRHQVRAIVHPVQLTECELLVQRAQWELTGRNDARATLVAERWLNGPNDWAIACPHCGASNIASLSVCHPARSEGSAVDAHVVCDSCASVCSVCPEVFCAAHGVGACHVDGAPACAEHARTCASCGQSYCTAHEARCAEGDHPACSKCISSCAICDRAVCEEHATDDLLPCASCGRQVCPNHSRQCTEDGAVHCVNCSTPLRAEPGKSVCRNHGSICHVDDGAYRVGETERCAVCAKWTCTSHREACNWCGRSVCVRDMVFARGRCMTCTQLRDNPQPPREIVEAVRAVLANRAGLKRWRIARDAVSTIVQVDVGWTRRVVLTVAHGRAVATIGRNHSVIRSGKLDRSA